VAASLQAIGMNVDDQAMDWGTVVQRRTSKEPLEKGGWSLFPAGAPAPEFLDPMLSNPMRSNGPKAWFGWPDDPELERLRTAWFDAPDLPAQQAIARRIQAAAMQGLPYIPTGAYYSITAHRRSLVDRVKGFAIFWGIRRT
jgi:peptide/nickel transport system substrate-binding protein